MTHGVLRAAATGLVVALTVAASPPVWALTAPEVDSAVRPPSGNTGPAVPMVQRGECATAGLIPGSDISQPSRGQRMLNLADAWRFSRGSGQTVAVIDTGVTRGPRLPNVTGGGDYVADTDGLVDCDGHGTLVAGIIAGQPGPDGFAGVAPAAQILAIRQTSAKFAPRTPGPDPESAQNTIDIGSLARAVVHAADLGAGVINISAVVCVAADAVGDQQALGAALRYAAVDKDAVVIAAAGNSVPGGVAGGRACVSNSNDWSAVSAVSVPSWWQPYVLSVGSVTDAGQPSAFTMGGPWLGIAAPGEDVVSVANGDGGLANGLPTERGQLAPISGTSFSAAYTAGVAALVRSRFPDLSAAQVIHRLAATAHSGARAPSNLVGAGTLDPVAALTWQLPDDAAGQRPEQFIAAPQSPEPVDHTPRTIALAGVAGLAVLVAATALFMQRRKENAE